jgi:hypothetical protein
MWPGAFLLEDVPQSESIGLSLSLDAAMRNYVAEQGSQLSLCFHPSCSSMPFSFFESSLTCLFVFAIASTQET